jgi:hypothetical protein
MKKIQSLFARNYNTDHLVRNEVVPGAEWVLAGEGKATVKWDGSSCLFRNGKWYKRYDAKHGKNPPKDFLPVEPEPDKITGHWPGWVPVNEHDYWHNEAIKTSMATTGERMASRCRMVQFKDGQTYELIGPKVQSNPESTQCHILVEHGALTVDIPNLSFDGIKNFLTTANIEGIVWHHPDGRMVKVKTKDFGLTRGT